MPKSINSGTASDHGLRVPKASIFSAGGSWWKGGFRHSPETPTGARFRQVSQSAKCHSRCILARSWLKKPEHLGPESASEFRTFFAEPLARL